MDITRLDVSNKDMRSELLLNPRLPQSQKDAAQRCFEIGRDTQNLAEGHFFLLTSGSEAGPKLIALSFEAIAASARAVNTHLKAEAKDVWGQSLPHFHVGGLGIYARAQLTASRTETFAGNWDPHLFNYFLESKHVTLTSVVPTQVFDLVGEKIVAPKNLRAAIVGGASLDPELYVRARKLGWPLLPSFGMTEAASQIATASLDELNNLNFPRLELMQHLQLQKSADGHLCFRGASMLSAQCRLSDQQWMDPKTTDGWYQSSDLGEISNEEKKVFLRPLGRSSRNVKVLGENVSLDDLEKRLMASFERQAPQKIRAVAVVVRPDARLGASLIWVLESDRSHQELESLVANIKLTVVAPFERCSSWKVLPKLPRSTLGKIQYSELANLVL